MAAGTSTLEKPEAPGRRGAPGAAATYLDDVGPLDAVLSRLNHKGSRTRCLRFAGRVTPAPRKTRFRLAGQPLPGRYGYLLGPRQEVSAMRLLPTSLPPPPAFPGATRPDPTSPHFTCYLLAFASLPGQVRSDVAK